MQKVFVGSLAYSTTEDQLNKLFAEVGTVVSAKIITDRDTGQSKGFAFVEMSSDAEAKAAVDKLNGQEVDGRQIAVSIARPKTDNPRPSFNNSRY
jgi:cold-inducible RNA-binding protein